MIKLASILLISSAIIIPMNTELKPGEPINVGKYTVSPGNGIYYKAECQVDSATQTLIFTEDIDKDTIQKVVDELYEKCVEDNPVCNEEELNDSFFLHPMGLKFECSWERVDI